jgi:galactose mutarotase-like enzyme
MPSKTALKTWTLADVEQDIYVEELRLGPADVGETSGRFAIHKRTLRGGLREGVDVVEVDNGALRFVILPSRGMGIWRAWLGDLEIGWQSPVKGPVHPSFVPLFEPSGIGWLSGFDELLCRCGLESNGAPQRGPNGEIELPLHGRIANLPAHRLEVSIDREARELIVSGVVDEARLFGSKLRLRSTVRTRWGEPALTITDEITNHSEEEGEFELLYHINFGSPLAQPGSKVFAPLKTLAPRDAHSATDVGSWDTYGPAAAGSREFAHFLDLAADGEQRTRVLLASPQQDRGVSLQFNRQQLPTFTLWKNQLLPADGYVTGLEPGINFPNVKSFERQQGRVAKLKPAETRRFELEMRIHGSPESVRDAKDDIASLGRGAGPQILDRPRPDWSPV